MRVPILAELRSRGDKASVLPFAHSQYVPARKNENGEIVLYQYQDEALWDQELIAKGTYYLHQS